MRVAERGWEGEMPRRKDGEGKGGWEGAHACGAGRVHVAPCHGTHARTEPATRPQDDYAEEIAKRARAAFGTLSGLQCGSLGGAAARAGQLYAQPPAHARGPGRAQGHDSTEQPAGLMDLLSAAEELRRWVVPCPRPCPGCRPECMRADRGRGAIAATGVGGWITEHGWHDRTPTLPPPPTHTHRSASPPIKQAPEPAPLDGRASPCAELATPKCETMGLSDARRPGSGAPSPSAHDELPGLQAGVQRLEAELGPWHPAVGRACIDLAAACMQAGDGAAALAKQSLTRAADIMSVCQVGMHWVWRGVGRTL